MSLLISQLDRFGRAKPDAVFMRDAAEDTTAPQPNDRTWGELRGATAKLAQQLKQALPDGAAVMVALPNSPALCVAILGCLAADLSVFPVSPELTDEELLTEADRSQADAIIGVRHARHTLADRVTLSIGSRNLPTGGHGEAIDRVFNTHRGTGSLLLHSSGTVGLPKVVRRSTASLDAVAMNCVEAIGVTESDRVLLPLPLFHSYGLEHGLLMPVIAGASVDLHGMFDAPRMIRSLAEQPITLLPGVPFMFEALVGAADKVCFEPDRLRVRHAYSAGGVLPECVANAFRKRYQMPLSQLFGSTEVGSVTFGDPSDSGFNPIAVGRPMNDVDIRIVDPDHPDLDDPFPLGEIGQIAVRASSMFEDYIATDERTTHDGYFLTGDLGRFDDRGNLIITGRLKLVIDIAGRKVNPMEVERVLESHPSVREAIVVSLPLTPTVNRLKAVIVPADDQGFDARAVRAYARQRLSGYKIPRVFETRPDLPRTAVGQVEREALLACVGD